MQFWMYEVAPSILESRLLSSNNIVDAAVVGITDKENGQVPRAFVVLRPGFEETEENVTNLMESRLGVSVFKYRIELHSQQKRYIHLPLYNIK